jgi:hypothetical protein
MLRLSPDVRSLIAEIVLPMLLVCAVDRAFTHFFAQSPTAPLPMLFPYPVSTSKYLAYRQLAAEKEPLDVLLMGMSQMIRANIGLVEAEVARDGGPRIRGFNFAAPLQSVEFNRRLLEDVLLRIKPPRVLVHGFLHQNLLFEDTPAQVEARARSLPVFDMHAGTPAARLQDFVFEHSDLMKYREVIRDQFLFKPTSFEPWVKIARTTDRSGDIALQVFAQAGSRLNPWEKGLTQRLEQFDDLMADTLLFEHIGDLARTCREHGIQLVVLNNAVHPLALEELPHGRDDYDRFVAELRHTAEANGVPFFDPAPGGIGDPRLFQDTVHHNLLGTQWLSEQLAHFLLARSLVGGAAPDAATPGRPQ